MKPALILRITFLCAFLYSADWPTTGSICANRSRSD